ncbi:unnamed protein product [Gadus morhua 'NCC']
MDMTCCKPMVTCVHKPNTSCPVSGPFASVMCGASVCPPWLRRVDPHSDARPSPDRRSPDDGSITMPVCAIRVRDPWLRVTGDDIFCA